MSSASSPEAILAALARTTPEVPVETLRAAEAHRAALTPPLVAAILELSLDPGRNAADPGRQLPFYAMYLLAAWRERLAHPALLAFLRLPGEQALDLSGDIVTEDMDRMLAQTAGGDPAGLLALILDPTVNEWSRAAALRALGLMHRASELQRPALVDHLRTIVAANTADIPAPDEPSQVLTAVVRVALDHRLIELRDELLPLADGGWIDACQIGERETIATEFADPSPDFLRPPIEDVAHAVRWWGCFKPRAKSKVHPGFARPAVDASAEPLLADTVPQPYRAPAKVGRNDPCPCGSGKKYKKCCAP